MPTLPAWAGPRGDTSPYTDRSHSPVPVFLWELPRGFPLPVVPADNPMSDAKIELGRHLFYENRLSGNQSQACATCHLQERAFTDGRATSVGSTGQGHARNAQTLANVAYNASYTWANPTLTTLEQQILVPMFGETPVELGITGHDAEILARLRQDQRYQALFADAFPTEAEPTTWQNIVNALASFVRTLVSGNSAYDRYVAGEQSALSASAARGMSLFSSADMACHHCHTGFNFSASTTWQGSSFTERPFFNTGLYNVDGKGAYPAGNTGLYEVSHRPEEMGRFRPPTLRNIALTAPYMHDGSVATLAEVVRIYAEGGRHVDDAREGVGGDGRDSPYKSGLVAGFEMTDQEMADLLAFLQALTDEEFVTNPRYGNPFVK